MKSINKERRKIKAGKVIISVIPLGILIEMKEKTDRPQDIADMFYLRKITEDPKR